MLKNVCVIKWSNGTLYRNVLDKYFASIKANYFLPVKQDSSVSTHSDRGDAYADASVSGLRDWYRIVHVCRAWRKLAYEVKEVWDFLDTSWPIEAQEDFIARSSGLGFSPRFLVHFAVCHGDLFVFPLPPSPFHVIDKTYPCKDAVPTLEGLKIHVIRTNYDQSPIAAWDTFRARHLSNPARRLKLLHLEGSDARPIIDFPMLSTHDQMLSESPFESVVLRNVSPRFLLGRLELDNLKFLEVAYLPAAQHEFSSLEALQILAVAPRIKTLAFNINSYLSLPVRSHALIKRPERLTVPYLQELSLELWPAKHLQYFLSCLDLPSIQHFTTSIHPNHSPKKFNWMKDAPSEIMSLVAQCRSARSQNRPSHTATFSKPTVQATTTRFSIIYPQFSSSTPASPSK
ncbi:hypothetical protein SISSUDRAFT_1068114 [Sistotremastrum suecicum HHB10207 ss-3]|uniref:Uncharacterized protein n=1 Tax=Sistotremastrum suecicum HHB10207 ss-3 TaxID=1314776 RepID=A0A165WFC4_9AGAM|nr:hypothetical protein SISSUDRAFT_1068114 [Sistotremastrum suecicum HHB10207 ss-3]